MAENFQPDTNKIAKEEEKSKISSESSEKIYDEEVYTKLSLKELIIFGIYSVLKKGETCTFERLVAECFTNFPKVFSFKRYPQWPDSLKLDRPLRKLRAEGLIVGGAGGRYSPGEFQLTEFGEQKAKEVEDILNNRKPTISPKKTKPAGRSVDEKLLNYLKENPKFKEFVENPDSFSISESEFRNILRCTLETSERVLKQNLEYYKNVAKSFNEKEIVNFLTVCEKKFIKKL